jgi:hypothetical protein
MTTNSKEWILQVTLWFHLYIKPAFNVLGTGGWTIIGPFGMFTLQPKVRNYRYTKFRIGNLFIQYRVR